MSQLTKERSIGHALMEVPPLGFPTPEYHDCQFIACSLTATQPDGTDTLQGFEIMNSIRKGQLQGVDKGDILGQVALVSSLFGVAA